MISEEVKKNLILSLLDIEGSSSTSSSFYQRGKDYIVRTVTMIYLGELKSEGSDHLVLTNCAWIPETSRWNEFVRGKKPNEMEVYPNDVIVYKGAIVDATELEGKMHRENI